MGSAWDPLQGLPWPGTGEGGMTGGHLQPVGPGRCPELIRGPLSALCLPQRISRAVENAAPWLIDLQMGFEFQLKCLCDVLGKSLNLSSLVKLAGRVVEWLQELRVLRDRCARHGVSEDKCWLHYSPRLEFFSLEKPSLVLLWLHSLPGNFSLL